MTPSSRSAPTTVSYNATIRERIDLTPKLSLFRISPDPGEGFPEGRIPDFLPGQYAILGLNNSINPQLGRSARAYSIASPPEEKRYLEFYIRYVDQASSTNPLTHLLWKQRAGDRIYVKPKLTGKFTIEDTVGNDDPRIKIFVAAGTGMAPFHSMVRSRLVNESLKDRMAILHGASYPNELGYFDVLSKLERNNPRFAYLPTISRPGEAASWGGDVGRVESFFSPERVGGLEQRLGLPPGGLNPSRAVIYICGLVGTIQETIKRSLKLGFVPENNRVRRALRLEDQEPSLFFEQYDTTPIVDADDPEALGMMLTGTPFEGRIPQNPSHPSAHAASA